MERYYSTEFINTYYAMNIALENYFADNLLKGDTTRVIKSSTRLALRKRSQSSDSSSLLEMPFLNYELTGTNKRTERQLANNEARQMGIFVGDIPSNVRIIPYQFSYEAVLWIGRSDDMWQAQHILTDLDSDETVLTASAVFIAEDDVEHTFPIPVILGDFQMTMDQEYKEIDWFEVNKVHSLGMKFSVDTFMLYTDEDIFLTDQFVLDFLYAKNLVSSDDLTEVSPQVLLQEYFS